jgi:hypothetical protein
MTVFLKIYMRKMMHDKLISDAVGVEGLGVILDGNKNVEITDAKGKYNWWTGQFYFNENIGSDSGYEHAGKKYDHDGDIGYE